MTEQPKEIYALCILFMVVSNFLWSTNLTMELKAVFFSLLFAMTLAFMLVFLEISNLEMENI
jgi:hypothetical protein